MNRTQSARLLLAASALLLTAGVISGFLGALPVTALLCVGAVCCGAAALNFGRGDGR